MKLENIAIKLSSIGGATLGTGIIVDQVVGSSWFLNTVTISLVGVITTASAIATAIRDKDYPKIMKIVNFLAFNYGRAANDPKKN